MIYQMARDVAAMLAADGFPVTIVYGETPITAASIVARSHSIEFARDRQNGDKISNPQGAKRDPRSKVVAVRLVGVRVVIRARVSVTGARINEHEHECDDLVDAVIARLTQWTTAAKCGGDPEWRESRYLAEDELGADAPATGGHVSGVAYLLRFGIPRGVTARRYDGVGSPTTKFAGIIPGVKVAVPGGDVEDVPLGGD